MMPDSEIGRELKVSELKPRTIVILQKKGRNIAVTMWVAAVTPEYVCFYAGDVETSFLAKRTGPDLEQITDDTGTPMRVYEYLGKP